MHKLDLTPLRLKKVKEIIKSKYRFYHLTHSGKLVYGRNVFEYIFHARKTNLLEFFTINNYSEIDLIIDNAYSKYILEEYNLLNKDANFKFDTIRNTFKDGFRTTEYMINHYSGSLSLAIIKILKKEFADLDILNIVIPKHSLVTIVRQFERGIFDHVRKEFHLMRAGPYNIRDPLIQISVA
jgi:hypothetical protein